MPSPPGSSNAPATPDTPSSAAFAGQMMVGAAASLGGNVRVGFEDNFYLPSGQMASSNGDLVDAAATIVRMQGREVAEPSDARAILSLPADPDRSPVLS